MKRHVLVLFVVSFLLNQFQVQADEGQLIEPTIPAPSLANCMIEDNSMQPILIYLPPSYDETQQHFPVVYYLPGNRTSLIRYLDGNYQGFSLKTSMDALINEGKVKEMIVVIANGKTRLKGSMYVNSPVQGNWEDYLAYDLVNYIDKNYRTLAVKESRGICGHSMGGFGAIHVGMNNTDVFSAIYAISPALFDENGLDDQGMFSSIEDIEKFISMQEKWAAMDSAKAFDDYAVYIQDSADTDTRFAYAYGSSFSPDSTTTLPYIKYPYYRDGNQIVCDSTILQNYVNGFGGWEDKVLSVKRELSKTKGIVIDYGVVDKYKWIMNGSRHLSSILTQNFIANQLRAFRGGHTDRLRSRIEDEAIPFFSQILDFDTEYTAVEKSDNVIRPDQFSIQNFPNPFNNSTLIQLNVPGASMVTVSIYNLRGQKVATLLEGKCEAGIHNLSWDSGNLPSGIYLCHLRTGNVLETLKLILQK